MTPEVALTESELRVLMDTWTASSDTFMDAVVEALAWKHAEAEQDRTLDDAAVAAVITEYDRVVRLNASTTEYRDVLTDVAHDDEGLYGVFGEVLDTANELGHDLTDADHDALEAATHAYQARLRAELAGTRCPTCGAADNGALPGCTDRWHETEAPL